MNEEKKIYSIRCWVDNKLQPATISFENGIITAIAYEKATDAEDFGDDILMPGIIDVHVHINEPGRTEWEGFDTATKAALAGGICSLVEMLSNLHMRLQNSPEVEIEIAADEQSKITTLRIEKLLED